MEWIKDGNGNKCSVEYFGSRELAQAALDSLINCENCTNCRDCSDCSGCSVCSVCRDCRDCSGKIKNTGENKLPTVPLIPDFHKAIYAAASHPGSLAMENVHTCENTHCRGGWMIALAGNDGTEMEDYWGWEMAAMLIYKANTGVPINPCRFYDSNADALKDMKRLAEA